MNICHMRMVFAKFFFLFLFYRLGIFGLVVPKLKDLILEFQKNHYKTYILQSTNDA